MSGFKKGFLWGGAVAAHQLEGSRASVGRWLE
ncbi:6-phospho-beta-glucosidase A [Escherichia coli]|nr:6-phospho-beta-glucosidase A [Escherichia coli]